MSKSKVLYSMCKHCDHFVDVNPNDGEVINDTTIKDKYGEVLCRYIHMEDGNQEFDHDAEPGKAQTLKQWKKERPELFKEYEDGAIGPNSKHHSQRGKLVIEA